MTSYGVGTRVLVNHPDLSSNGEFGTVTEIRTDGNFDCWVLIDGHDLVSAFDYDELLSVDHYNLGDVVNHPAHYTSHPSGIEVIQITEHENFCIGNAVKYLLRADLKGNPIQDLEKARWYVEREINRRKKETA